MPTMSQQHLLISLATSWPIFPPTPPTPRLSLHPTKHYAFFHHPRPSSGLRSPGDTPCCTQDMTCQDTPTEDPTTKLDLPCIPPMVAVVIVEPTPAAACAASQPRCCVESRHSGALTKHKNSRHPWSFLAPCWPFVCGAPPPTTIPMSCVAATSRLRGGNLTTRRGSAQFIPCPRPGGKIAMVS